MSTPDSAASIGAPAADQAPVTADEIARLLEAARARTLAICDQQAEDDQRAQQSPLMSPMVWDLAHIGNYEELWLLRELDGRPAVDPTLDDLYNAFEHPRWERPSLPILGPDEARAYDASVRAAVLDLLATVDLDTPPTGPDDRRGRLVHQGFVYGMVAQHEHQHCETLLATLQLMGARAVPPPGTSPAPHATATTATTAAGTDDATADLVRHDGGCVVIGTDDRWAYDNERPLHAIELPPFALGRDPVTVRQWRAFVDDGGYDDVRLWTEAGWAWRREAGLEAPRFWRRVGEGAWCVERFGRQLDLDDLGDEPVQHVSCHEAEAFCRWSGTRLPTEHEWEAAARWDPTTGRSRRFPWGDDEPTAAHANLGQRHDGPAPVGSYPDGASPLGVQGLIGDVWEWTASSFLPHPDYATFPYAEYSEVFFGDEYRVLRGGSWAADPVAVRGAFRNWDYPIRRQIFCGLRVARDA